jgi:hypothetical protein
MRLAHIYAQLGATNDLCIKNLDLLPTLFDELKVILGIVSNSDDLILKNV